MPGVNEQVIDSVTTGNVKTIAEAGSFYTQMGFSNAVANQQLAQANALAHQQAMNQISQAATGALVKSIIEVDPSQAVAEQKVLSGNDTAGFLAALLAALNSGQQGVKAAGNTPPVTP